jgi:hypothetical protein
MTTKEVKSIHQPWCCFIKEKEENDAYEQVCRSVSARPPIARGRFHYYCVVVRWLGVHNEWMELSFRDGTSI